jgi:hypothetical protein
MRGAIPQFVRYKVQAEARDVCVGKQIEWPQLGNRAVDQEWFSVIDQRTRKFSSFAYVFISFDLVLDGWFNEPHDPLGPFEADFLHELPRLRGLLDECEFAASSDANEEIRPLISKAREFFDAFETSILARVGSVRIETGSHKVRSLWGCGRPDRGSAAIQPSAVKSPKTPR